MTIERKLFKPCKENFTCLQCENSVEGDGYTNHCPKCLWSRHVDINPGDRQAKCAGAMEPIRIELKSNKKILTHRCLTCQIEKRITLRADDNFEKVLEIMSGKLTFL